MKRFRWLCRTILVVIAFAIAYSVYPYAPGATAAFRYATALSFAGVVLLVDGRNWYFVVGEYLASASGFVLFEMLSDRMSPASKVLGACVGWIVAALGLRLAIGFGEVIRTNFVHAMAKPVGPRVGE